LVSGILTSCLWLNDPAAAGQLVARTQVKADPKPESGQKAAELAWARDMADDFLAAALAGRMEAAKAVLTPEYQRTFDNTVDIRPLVKNPKTRRLFLQGQPLTIVTDEDGRMIMQNDKPVTKLNIVFRKFHIEMAKIAPDADEAVFKGKLSGEAEGSFTVRVIKEKKSGKWRVSFFDPVAVKKTPTKVQSK
jgi:hypothetical protein